MSETVCRVCLSSDFSETDDIEDTLKEFHNELCKYDIYNNPSLKFCPTCVHLLRKFYNFREKCRRANDILKIWSRKQVLKDLNNLYELMPPSSMRIQYHNEDNVIEISHSEEIINDISVKIEEDAKTDSTVIIEALKLDLLDQTQENDIELNVSDINFKIEDDNDNLSSDFEEIKLKSHSAKRKKSTKVSQKTQKAFEDVKEESLLELSERIKAKRKKFCKNQSKLRDRILELIELGEFQDLGDNVTMNREIFLKMFEKCDKTGLRSMLPLKPGSSEERQRLRKFLLYLLKKNNPEYDSIFDVEHLDTYDKKLAEFERRKHTKEYVEAPIKCNICFKVFEVQRLLDYHNRWHEPAAGPHACDICGMRFASRKALSQHLKTNHHAVYRCRLCPLLTYNPAMMVNHYNQHKGVEYSCPVCLSVFSNKNTLNNHRRQAHRTGHICPLCARSFVSEKGLYFHRRLKHKDELNTKSENAVSCDKCDAILDSPEILLRHVRAVHENAQTIFSCFHCKDIFGSLDELKQHKVASAHQRPARSARDLTPRAENTVECGEGGVRGAGGGGSERGEGGERPTCGECGKTYNNRKSYLRHVNLNHKRNRIHKCGFCQGKFRSAEELTSHRAQYGHQRKARYVKKPRRANPGAGTRLRCKDPARPFEKCQLCSEMVSTSRTTAMYQHFLSSHPDVPYSSVYAQPSNIHLCEQCGKTFRDLTFFIDHKNLHTGAKPYACGVCPRAYAARRHLKLHAARHAPPTHACTRCGKMFHSAGNLYAHTRGHIGDRRFKCEICGKGFLHAAALSEHVRGVHHHLRRRRTPRDP